MNKLISKILLTLVVASMFILLAIPSKVAFAQTPTSAPETTAPSVTTAKAQISGSGITGTLNLKQVREGYVLVDATLKGDPKILTAGLHGFHIHETGSCQESGETAFSSAKGHFDPGPFSSSTPVEKNHPYHMGDLQNIEVDESGLGKIKTVTSRFTLSESPLSVFDNDGSAIIVHKLKDQIKAGGTAAEAGGARLACGVIVPQSQSGG